MQIRAYTLLCRRVVQPLPMEHKLTVAQVASLARLRQRLQCAVDVDPHESVAIEVPDEEWDVYTLALNDYSGGED